MLQKSLFIFIFLSNSILFGQHFMKPSFNSGAGCSGSGCHLLNSGIVSAKMLDSTNVEVTVSGVTAGKAVAGELVNSSGIVVDYINSTKTNPFILKATASGTYRINAGFNSPARQWDSTSVAVTIQATATPDSGWQSTLIITEIMFDVPKNAVGDANGDGSRGSRSDEFIELYNSDSSIINLSGYQILEREKAPVFTFPENSILNPGQFAVIFGAVGTSGYGRHIPGETLLFSVHENDNTNIGFDNGLGKTNFSNSGDCVVLVNPLQADTLAEIYWGSANPVTSKPIYLAHPNTLSGGLISGAIRQSVTRQKNAVLWDMHTIVSADSTSFFSPGWDVTTITSIKTKPSVPSQFSLYQNYPNPFNPSTTIRFDLKKAASISLLIYNTKGEKIATLINNKLYAAGGNVVHWNASGLASGLYLYRLQSGDGTEITRKMLLIK